MKKPVSIFGFLMIYIGLIVLYHLSINLIFYFEFTSLSASILHSIARVSLVGIGGNSHSSSPFFIHFSLVITQLSGLLWLTTLLWIYWKLLDKGKKKSTKDALLLTIKVSLICEAGLLIFFLYSVPIELVEHSFQQKILVALNLSITSFNNAGLSDISQLMLQDSIQSSFILQLGIIGGSTLGNLGIFVIDELFAPRNLRKRLANAETDWSLITKISIFVFAAVLFISSGLFFFYEQNNALESKNLIESIITSVYEVSTSRGFGYSITNGVNQLSELILLLTRMVAAGPFSTGGGLTLITILWVYSFLSKREASNELIQVNHIAKNLIVYGIIAFGIFTSMRYATDESAKYPGILYDQWMLFSTNTYNSNQESSWLVDMAKGLTIISGRLGFVVACYLTLRKKEN